MNYQISQQRVIAPGLMFAAVLLFSQAVNAEVFPFRVAFENVPGIDEIEAGDIPAGIELLVNELNEIERAESGDTWATLCGAYIVSGSLRKAGFACDKAVEVAPTETAFNNRGVYRAFTGDLSGAREDFQRARPQQLEAYLEQLRARDVGLMAVDNFDLLNELSTNHTYSEITGSTAIQTAAVESLVD